MVNPDQNVYNIERSQSLFNSIFWGNMKDEKVLCRTTTPGKKPTRIDAWKYDLMKRCILEIVGSSEKGVLFCDLPALIREKLPPEESAKLGSISWYTTTVKLDMEVKGEIKRIPGSKPQKLVVV